MENRKTNKVLLILVAMFLTLMAFSMPVQASVFPISDDFNSLSLNNSLWTTINPKNDAQFNVIGTGTPDALLSISVPAGPEHDVWITNNAPRIMQSIDNKDFDIELKFQSPLTSQYQMQGMIIQQDSSKYLRFDFVRDSIGTRIFAASFSPGYATKQYDVYITSGNPLYLRVNRIGNQWKQFYSYDGTNWIGAANFNYPLIVSSAGPFAGNGLGGSSPGFTCLVDYFFDTTSPIVPEDVVINQAPVIITQPLNQTVTLGQNAIFSVGAIGTAPLSYQWKKNGSDIPGATGSTYTTPATTLLDNGSKYSVNVTNPVGSNMSNLATLTVRTYLSPISDDFNALSLNTALWTRINPKNDAQINVIGTGTPDAVLSIAVPPGPEHDVWITNNAPRIMQSIDNKDFEIELKFQSPLTSQYQMQGMIIQQDSSKYLRFDFVRDSIGTRIFAASFSSGLPIKRYDAYIPPGNPLYLRVNRTGNQWRQFYSYDATNWITAANFNYPMIVSSVGPFAGNGLGGSSPGFTCLVDYFFDTSSPIVPEDVVINQAPVIITQPLNQTVTSGQNAIFSVGAIGTAPLSYQWKKNGSDIPGATGSTYTTPATTLLDNGSKYSVNVTNPVGSILSKNATLTVISSPPPIITIHPSNQTVNVGQTATFSVVATGASLSYQWQKNGTNIIGATGASYTTSPTTLLDNGSTFNVNVSNPAGSILSKNATLTVNPPPSGGGILKNPGFESGTDDWWFYTNGQGFFTVEDIGYGFQVEKIAHIGVTIKGSNTQLSQMGLSLKPYKKYRLTFDAYSTTSGHDLTVRLLKHGSPYTNYGLNKEFDLGMDWQTFTFEFTTTGFSSNVNDGRLMFWLAPYAYKGDNYFIDNVILEQI